MPNPSRWLLLRGLVRESGHWGSFPELLAAAGIEAHTLDLPGTGSQNDRPSPTTIAEITDDLRARFLPVRDAGTGPVGLFAVSLGGMIALDWVSRYPDDFAACVVCNTSSGTLSSPFERFRPPVWPLIVRAALSSGERRERHILSIVTNLQKDPDASAERHAALMRKRPIAFSTFIRQLTAATRARLPERVPVPLTVLVSEADRLVSPDCSRRIAEKLGAPIRVHPSAGHDLPMDDPHWVVEQIRTAMA